jgi:HPt (histidine-containing phosphotransfer) domain-containing protein
MLDLMSPASAPAAKKTAQPTLQQAFLPLEWPSTSTTGPRPSRGTQSSTLELMEFTPQDQEEIVDLTDIITDKPEIMPILSLDPAPISMVDHTREDDQDTEPSMSELLDALNGSLLRLSDAIEQQQSSAMLPVARDIAGIADTYGLHIVGGLARCMELAALDDDMKAVDHLIPDLREALERNIVSFSHD